VARIVDPDTGRVVDAADVRVAPGPGADDLMRWRLGDPGPEPG
jgi:hypothetical protein